MGFVILFGAAAWVGALVYAWALLMANKGRDEE